MMLHASKIEIPYGNLAESVNGGLESITWGRDADAGLWFQAPDPLAAFMSEVQQH